MPDTAQREIIIRDIKRIAEMREVEELQKEVWGFADRDLLPLTTLVAAVEVGAILIGAFDDDQLVGFVYGFLGSENGRTVIHSDMLAVRPLYRRLHLGYKLKLAQRERAIAQGINRITWTFDPLQSLNAHLNFNKLGVISDRYKINFYGEETSSFLHQMGTDRLWVTWPLNSQRVRRRLAGDSQTALFSTEFERAIRLVQWQADGTPRRSELDQGCIGEYALIEIPGDINSLQQHAPELAIKWREATRQAFTEALAAGYLVQEFYRSNENNQRRGVYLLSFGKQLDDFM